MDTLFDTLEQAKPSCWTVFENCLWFRSGPIVLEFLFPFSTMEKVVEHIYKQLININQEALQSSFDSKISLMADASNIIDRGILLFDPLLNT